MSMKTNSVLSRSRNDERVSLHSPTSMPNATGFVWNSNMLLQMNCRGYAVAQFMQPEPAKYAHAPMLEAKTFIQPEHHYFAHHPGRFFYIKDQQSGELFSLPYEPVRNTEQDFCFSCFDDRMEWRVECLGLILTLVVKLSTQGVVEHWQLNIENPSTSTRDVSIYAYFPTGYMSWMNQSAQYYPELNGTVCHSITPYQKVEDYFKNQQLHDLTYLLCDQPADAWETRQVAFEGEGGLSFPDGIREQKLACGTADYEVPTNVLQFDRCLTAQQTETLHFAFGPAKDIAQVEDIKRRYLNQQSPSHPVTANGSAWGQQTDDADFDHFCNYWLPRQVRYHGQVNRLSTDPQTRNYLQDAMGMIYLEPSTTRVALLRTLSQQQFNGALPDGILLRDDAELKYINQVPHTDHNIWLPIVLRAYLLETADFAILDCLLPYQDSDVKHTLKQHVDRAMEYLWHARDERGLHYIEQGDWCDPMNMVGYKGKGVSSWLTLATSVAYQQWAEILNLIEQTTEAESLRTRATHCNAAVNRHCWDGHWYARGITDDGNCFGTSSDSEGSIFLNPQSWGLWANAASNDQKLHLIDAVERQLVTPHGTEMLAPAYTKMREDVGRVTQKFPGTAENGSIYNHAMAFYIYALYQIGEADKAYHQLRLMVPDLDDPKWMTRGQLPTYIPNYYRGAHQQKPKSVGRSSHLFNTGTCSWVARCLLECLFGIVGTRAGLKIQPQLPSHWQTASISRTFRGAQVDISYIRDSHSNTLSVAVNGDLQPTNHVTALQAGQHYQITVKIGRSE